jgi:hypothetical protein
MQCADYGVLTDCRTYFITPTLAGADDWHTRWVRNTASGAYTGRLIEGWPRPEEYNENDDYLVWDWQGLGIPRWVAVHLVLGTWDSQLGFVDGESIPDVEARLGRTVGPVMLKLELTEDYTGGGKDVTVTATNVTGESVTLEATVPPGSRAGAVIPLNWHPHHYYPRGYRLDVTAIVPEEVNLDEAFLEITRGAVQ